MNAHLVSPFVHLFVENILYYV